MHRSAWILIGSILILACNDDDPVEPPPTQPAEHEWQATLEGLEGWEHLSGGATVEFTEGETEFAAMAEIAGDEPDAVRPWHVHFNSCAVEGDIVGQDGDYPRLEVGPDGTAEASVVVPQSLNPGAEYHVNVHLSDADLATIIMCGDLMLTE